MVLDVSDLEKKTIQTNEKVTLHVDQIEAELKEVLEHSKESTRALIEESIVRNGNKLEERDREIEVKLKYLEEKINQNSEKHEKVAEEMSQAVQDFSHLHGEQLRNLKSETEIQLKKQNQQNESKLSSVEHRLTGETENKISCLGMLFIRIVVVTKTLYFDCP